MPIHSGSRYEDSIVDYFRKEEYGQSLPTTIYQFDPLTDISFTFHKYAVGETLQGIALEYYRNPSLWWTIAEYNPEITDLLHIPSGTVLRLPHA